MTGRIIVSALLSRPSLIRNVGDVKVKQLIAAAMMRPDDEEDTGGAGPVSCSFPGTAPAAGPEKQGAGHEGRDD
jgi:hypothetical protein